MPLVHGLHLDNLKGDVYGGLTAAVVALPLALAFGVASGAGPVAGVYGAIFVGFFAAVFGGTPAQVSGPTGPMTVVMAAVVTEFAHEPAMAFTVVMMAGVMQIAFGVMKLGRYINLMPYPVLSGFMTGIGCIIIILQLGPLVGHANPGSGVLAALVALPGAWLSMDGSAAALGFGALAVAAFTPSAIGRLIPSPLAALILGTVASLAFLGDVPVLGDIPTGLPEPTLPSFNLDSLPDMLRAALVLALLGAIDSLLTSLIADNVTGTRHDSDRELVGQGIGNTVAGLMGAIPGAGATMRTVVNVRAGGRTPISGALHALVLLGVMLGLGGYAAHIPHAVLAGILVKVGIDIIDWNYLRRARRAPRSGVVVMLTVLGLTVLVDLITAVAVGVVMKSLMFVKQMSDLQVDSVKAMTGTSDSVALPDDEAAMLAAHEGEILYVHIGGPLSFGAASEVSRRLVSRDRFLVVILDFGDVPAIDSSAAFSVENMIRNAQDAGERVLTAGLRPAVASVLERLDVLPLIPVADRLATRADAFRAAIAALEAGDGAAPDRA